MIRVSLRLIEQHLGRLDTPNAHHHPPEAALGSADTPVPGRVHDDVRPQARVQGIESLFPA